MRELFTNAGNGKTAVKNAVTGVDPTIVIPPDATFAQLAEAIGKIKVGMKYVTGSTGTSYESDSLYGGFHFKVPGLTFIPRVILASTSTEDLSSSRVRGGFMIATVGLLPIGYSFPGTGPRYSNSVLLYDWNSGASVYEKTMCFALASQNTAIIPKGFGDANGNVRYLIIG